MRAAPAPLAIRLAVGLAKIVAGIVLAVFVFLVGTVLEATGALPPYAGHFETKGLKAPVEIVRDKNAVPHIIAGSIEDAAFGLGFVHAQDRFWQMEFMRRLGQGRLSELVPPALIGGGLIDTDRTMRGLGVYRHASDSVGALSPATRGILEAYAAGVNAWLAESDRQFGLELTLVKLLSGGRYRPEPWQPADSMVWTKIMALTLDGNWRAELFRLSLQQRIGEDGVKFLIEHTGDNSADATLSLARQAMNGVDLERLYRATDNIATRKREASNEWVLSGAHSLSGKPMLANDPHLGLGFPGVWYLARLVGPGFDIRGASPPGVPAIALGHNASIAWGFTTTNLDSQDLFVERVDPTDPNRYLTPDGARPFNVYDETINVAWGEPIRLHVRETRHGAVIDDFIRHEELEPGGHVLSLQATALDDADTTMEALIRLGLAQNWNEFIDATRKVVSPMQNVVYADTQGNIGITSPARVPIRRKGDGSMPEPGWTGEFDWAGFVPFDELPRAFNPPSGIIVNANARLVPDDYRFFISRDWGSPYRQRRANQLLREVDRHAVYGMIAIQADILTPDAAEILPLLLQYKPRTARAAKAHELMGGWNRFMLASRPEPLIYDAWLKELERGLLANKVGAGLFAALATPNIALIERILRERPDWCDDRTTPAVETCDDVVAQALERALDGVARVQGPDMESWQWGREHRAAYRHSLFDGVPLLRDLASVRFIADGGSNTLNRAQPAYAGPHPFEAVHGATYRGVYDLGDLDNSRFAIPLGQSGNMFSPWAHNYLERWQSLSYLEIPGSRAEAARGAVGSIGLSPPAR